jgi:hypothetical protein
MGLTDRLANAWGALTRADPILTLDQVQSFYYGGNSYTYQQGINQSLIGHVEEIDDSFAGYVGGYKGNGVLFACMQVRLALFKQIRFQFRQLRNGTPGDLFGTSALDLLEHPWPNAGTANLAARAIQDADTAGNFYAARRMDRIRRMRPDWVTIVLGSEGNPAADARDLDAEVIGYIYHPGGRHSGIAPEGLTVRQVAHWAPIPDPFSAYKGMTWITPIVRDIMGDSAARDHKLKFFENGATPNMVVGLDKDMKQAASPQAFKEWVAAFKDAEPRAADAYRTLYLAGGTNIEVVGKDLQQLDFKVTQGAGESRIAAASGIHPTIVGLSEGLQGSSLNSGNFGAARRLTGDKFLHPEWAGFAQAMSTITDVPTNAELWYDVKDIPFLAEDVKDRAEVLASNASTIRQLVDAGFEPDEVVDAVEAEDLKRLKGKHTGLFSVQLQPPKDKNAPDPALLVPGTNGTPKAIAPGG